MCLSYYYEYMVKNMPDFDLLGFFDTAYSDWTKYLFVYIPLITCLLSVIYFLDFIRAGMMVTQDCASGKYYKGTIVGHTVSNLDFKDSGKCPWLIYPIVRYTKKGIVYETIGHKASLRKKNTPYSIRICADGESYRSNAGFLVATVGIFGILASLIIALIVWNSGQIFIAI